MSKKPVRIAAAFFALGYALAWFVHASDWRASLASLRGKPLEVWNWCPRDVSEVTNLTSKKTFTIADDLKLLCAARIDEAVAGDAAAGVSFTAVFRAKGPSGQLTFVERETGGDRFRVDGRVFRSRQLGANADRFQ